MEVRFAPAVEAKLTRLAAQTGRVAEELVNEAVERLVDYDEWFVREVEKGLAQIEQGQLVDHEEVGARMEEWLREKQPNS